MARHETTTKAQEDAMNAAQVAFTANPLFLAPQVAQFWQTQERVLGEVEKLSAAWFRRRQDATRSMIDIARRAVAEGRVDPATTLKDMVEWQTRSMERLAEDARDCTEMLGRCSGVFGDAGADEDDRAATRARPQN